VTVEPIAESVVADAADVVDSEMADTAAREKWLAPPLKLAPGQALAIANRYGLRGMGVRPPLGRYIKALSKRRDLIWELADSSAYARNQGSYLGQAWAVLDPLLLAIFYVLVFGMLFPPGDRINNIVGFIVVGVFSYSFFQNGTLGGAGSILGRQELIRSHQFPRAVVPISVVITEAIRFAPALLVMVVVTWFSRFLPGMQPVPISWRWLLAIPAFFLLTVFVTGMALLFARMCARAPDLRSVLPFFFSLLMIASGAMFPISQFANAFGRVMMLLLQWQPMGVYLFLMRSSLLRETVAPLSWQMWVAGVIWAVVSLVVGFLYFWRAEASYGRE